MLPGPVFSFELMKTARRGRFYLVRAFYAVVLLLILWTVHSAWTADTGGNLLSHQVKWFAFSTYCSIAGGQEALVLALTPALVAGLIADEKQRKTLHYLLASQLSGAEIVVGKLLVRMLYVTVLLGVSLPILSLLVLLGGIDPRLILLACGATFSTAWFLAALSIWVSTISRRVREAVFVAYGLEALWLFSPTILENLPVSNWPVLDGALKWIHDWLGTSSPVYVVISLFMSAIRGGGVPSSELELIAWMMGLQAAFGLMLAALASWQLRPVFLRQDGGGGVRVFKRLRTALKTRGRLRLWRRPALGNRPMIWKELYTGGSRGMARVVGFLLTVIGGGFLVFNFVWYGALAIYERWDMGYNWSQRNAFFASSRWHYQMFVYFAVPLLYVLGMLGVAGAAAAAVTTEHEDDTWVSLTATDITGREVVFAKLLGALVRGRGLAEFIILMVVTGAVVGSIHPLSIPLELIALPVYGTFAAALGIWISLFLRSTWRAQVLTISCLLLVNVTGQVILNASSRFGFAPQLWPGFTPAEIVKFLLPPYYLEELAQASWPRSWWPGSIDDGPVWRVVLSALSLLGYAGLTALLIWHSVRRFNTVAGRARRSRLIAVSTPPTGPDAKLATEWDEPALAAGVPCESSALPPAPAPKAL